MTPYADKDDLSLQHRDINKKKRNVVVRCELWFMHMLSAVLVIGIISRMLVELCKQSVHKVSMLDLRRDGLGSGNSTLPRSHGHADRLTPPMR